VSNFDNQEGENKTIEPINTAPEYTANETQSENKNHKAPKSVFIFYILSIVGGLFFLGFMITVITGDGFSIMGGDAIHVERNEAVIGAVVAAAVTGLSVFLGNKVTAVSAKNAEKAALLSTVEPTEKMNIAYKQQKSKCKGLRIAHYILLGIMLISPIIGISTEGTNSTVSDAFGIIFILSLFAYIPVLIIFLVEKSRLKKMPGNSNAKEE